MATKFGNWLMAAGALIIFVGLCFLPAAFGPGADKTMLGGGSVVIATGMMLIAAGFYVKAREMSAIAQPASSAATAKRSRSKSNCDMCAQEEPVIQCRVHQLHLCATCLAKHYDFRSCAYVPSTRRASAKSANAAYSQTSSG